MITTDDEALANRIRQFNSLGYAAVGAAVGEGKITKEVIQDPGYERHATVGFNYRLPELCAAVALAQIERMDALVKWREDVAEAYLQAIEGCDWLTPQEVPETHAHSYWAFTLHLDANAPCSWREFHEAFQRNAGEAFYGAWRLTYTEPAFRDQRFHPAQRQEYAMGLCPIAERIQPRLMQLKTNYWSVKEIERQSRALSSTIRELEGRAK
jgi:perosamine synthetase